MNKSVPGAGPHGAARARGALQWWAANESARSSASGSPVSGGGAGSRGTGVFLAFAPWIIFDVIAGPSTWKLAALAALIASIVLTLPDLTHGLPKLLDIVGITFFAVISVLGVFLDRGQLIWLETYAQTISNGVLALTALGSLAVVPFTEQYARESTPREVWGSPVFKRTNRTITAVWGLVFAVTAVLGLVALHVNSGTDWLNWVIPVILLVLAVCFTRWYPAYVRSQVRGESPRVQ